MITPVIHSVGSGTRLWPLSWRLNPKQFLKLFGDRTMLQHTLDRLKGLPCDCPIVICNEEHRFVAGEQLLEMEVKDFSIILESTPKTAPAIALATIHAAAQESCEGKDGDLILLVLPVGHMIADAEPLHKSMTEAFPAARNGWLVIFGIVPERPEIGYGYIKRGEKHENNSDIYAVASFREKPEEETAREYIKSGKYYWNSGMFLFLVKTYLEELQKHAPDVHEAYGKAMKTTTKDLDFIRLDKKAFELSPSISIDYAVMEKTNLASVVPLDAGWSDIGSWTALWEACEKDKEKNSIVGDVKAMSTEYCLIRAENKLVATIGIKNLVIVETKDAVLVAHKDQVQKIRDLVEDIKSSGHNRRGRVPGPTRSH